MTSLSGYPSLNLPMIWKLISMLLIRVNLDLCHPHNSIFDKKIITGCTLIQGVTGTSEEKAEGEQGTSNIWLLIFVSFSSLFGRVLVLVALFTGKYVLRSIRPTPLNKLTFMHILIAKSFLVGHEGIQIQGILQHRPGQTSPGLERHQEWRSLRAIVSAPVDNLVVNHVRSKHLSQ